MTEPMQELITGLRTLASRSKRKVRRIIKPPKPRVVQLPSDEQLFSSLVPEATLVTAAVEDWRSGSTDTAKSKLVAHYQKRVDPKFFCDTEAVHRAVTQTGAPWDEWHKAHKDWIGRELDGWASVYTDAARISSAGEWSNIPPGPGGDILYPERPNRFDFAPSLALARLTCEEAEAQLEQILSTWCQATYDVPNPVGYISTHLCVYRIIALAWAHAFLMAKPPKEPGLEVMLLKILLADLRHVSGRISRTAANNHLLADSFALWFGATLYPEFRDAAEWCEVGEAIWLRELERQIYPDGCGIEHSSHYQEHVLELLAAYIILGRLNGQEPPQWIIQRFERMLIYQCRLGGPEAVPFALGDTTEDPLFALDSERAWGMAAWRELHAFFFSEHSAHVEPNSLSRERAYWLLGGRFSSGPEKLVYPSFEAFSDGGYYVFSNGDEGTRLIFRTGPRKGPPLRTGHMHSDLLSVYLSVGGNKLICESGTYTYRSNMQKWPDGEPPWRQYFLGTQSSNGLEIVGVDALDRGPGDFPSGQGEHGTACFAEQVHAAHGPGLASVEARTTGSNAYHGHHRGVVHVVDQYWIVYDDLTELGRPFDAALNFQLAPGTVVHRLDQNRTRLVLGKTGVRISTAAGNSTSIVLEGEIDPIAGWVSQSYGDLKPAPVLRYKLESTADHHALLMLPDLSLDRDARLTCHFDDRSSMQFHLETAEFVDYLVMVRGDPPEDLQSDTFGIVAHAQVYWLRTRGEELEEIRFLDLRNLKAPSLGLSLQAKDEPVSAAVRLKAGKIEDLEELEKSLLVDWRPA